MVEVSGILVGQTEMFDVLLLMVSAKIKYLPLRGTTFDALEKLVIRITQHRLCGYNTGTCSLRCTKAKI